MSIRVHLGTFVLVSASAAFIVSCDADDAATRTGGVKPLAINDSDSADISALAVQSQGGVPQLGFNEMDGASNSIDVPGTPGINPQIDNINGETGATPLGFSDNDSTITPFNPVPLGGPIVFADAQPFNSTLADNGRGNVYSGSVNTALVSGPTIGDETISNNDLYRSIPFVTEGVSSEFRILHALALSTGSPNNIGLLIHLQNNSNETRCLVRQGGVSTFDSSGAILTDGLLNFGLAKGSLGVTASGTYTSTCIAPNQIVYMTTELSESIVSDQIAGIRVGGITSQAGADATLRVEPISYEIDNNGVISVTVANRSSATINLNSSSLYVISDNGVPVYEDEAPQGAVLLPGDETTLTYLDNFKGSASTIRVLLDYDPI